MLGSTMGGLRGLWQKGTRAAYCLLTNYGRFTRSDTVDFCWYLLVLVCNQWMVWLLLLLGPPRDRVRAQCQIAWRSSTSLVQSSQSAQYWCVHLAVFAYPQTQSQTFDPPTLPSPSLQPFLISEEDFCWFWALPIGKIMNNFLWYLFCDKYFTGASIFLSKTVLLGRFL